MAVGTAQAQEPGDPEPAVQEPVFQGAYLIPQTVFVGDKGRLVVPLGRAFEGAGAFVREGSGVPAAGGDILISRVELEYRNGAARLLIDFIPYAPGIQRLPPLEIPGARGEPPAVTGLEITVASILDSSAAALSPNAPPMAAPGTSLLIYGSLALILLILLGIGGGVLGRSRLGKLLEGFRRRRLIRVMERILRRGRAELRRNSLDPPERRELLARLAGEFRQFLTLYTGINCQALTPPEIGTLPGGAASLGGLFRRWDALRFSGLAPAGEAILSTLDEAGAFIAVLAAGSAHSGIQSTAQGVSQGAAAEGGGPG
jgi:hypothetical protein